MVSEIIVEARRPSFSGFGARWRAAARSVGLHHATTRESVVRRFLALSEGQPCSEIRRSESERVLRQQPYLSMAEVRTEPDGRGGARVFVVTQDEIPAIVGLGVSHGRPSSARLGSSNLQGSAIRAEVGWQQGDFYRDGVSAHMVDYQALGRPYVFDATVRRDPLGGGADARLFHPFYTDLQRFAWLGAYGADRDFINFRRIDADNATISARREFWNVGGVVRIGQPGRLSLFGAAVSSERTRVDARPFVVTDSGLIADSSSDLFDKYPSRRAIRLNALWGVRNVRYLTVRRFDALTGQQDVRRGLQFGTLIGRSVSTFGAADEDFLVGGNLYMGGGTAHSFGGLEVTSEGRQGSVGTRWEGVLTSGRAAWYNTITGHHTLVTSVDYASVWQARYPVQLRLGDPDGGVRGYSGADVSGGSRGVLRVEDRAIVGRIRSFADIGVAGFVDAGRTWAGDAPFGVTTPIRVGVGVGLLAAVPLGSKRLYRVDFALPTSKEVGAKFAVRFTVGDRTRAFLDEPYAISRARDRAAPTSAFNWP